MSVGKLKKKKKTRLYKGFVCKSKFVNSSNNTIKICLTSFLDLTSLVVNFRMLIDLTEQSENLVPAETSVVPTRLNVLNRQ